MITVRMIQYWNDYHKREQREQFRDLKELEEWIFAQMRVDYSSGHGRNWLSFPRCDTECEIYQIPVRPEYGGYVYWIKLIEDGDIGIMFSDDSFTAGQRHCTNVMREWLAKCEARKKTHAFCFAEDGTGIEENQDSYEQRLGRYGGTCAICHCSEQENKSSGGECGFRTTVKRAAAKIHVAGGCDAGDDYSSGYDDGITTALEILLKETGYCLEDIMEMDELYGSE